MKTKIMLSAMAVITVIFTASAQHTMGIKGGISFGNLSGFEGNSRTSGHLGLYLHHTINRNWCFQPELLYSGEGQQYFTDGEERTIALDYIQLPLMLQYFPMRQFYLEFGPQVGVLVSAQDKGFGPNLNVKDDFATAQLAIGLGAGVKLNQNLGVYGRYNFGLTDVSKFDNITDQSQVGQIGLSLKIK